MFLNIILGPNQVQGLEMIGDGGIVKVDVEFCVNPVEFLA